MKKKNNNKSEKYFITFAIIIGLFVLTICILRACLAGITYDEAYTYLQYVKTNPLSVFKSIFASKTILANNHLLNSFAISVVQLIFRVKYSAFLIRLPNVISYVVYLVFAYKLAKKYQYRYFTFSLLACSYGLNEFISIARGYGMACAIVMIGIYYLKVWLDNPSKYKYLNWAYLFLLISCYANTTCLLVFASVILFSQLYILFNNKIKENFYYIRRNIIVLLLIIIGTLIIIYFHFKVSSDGLPLYGGKTGFLTDVLASYPYLYGIDFYNNIIVILTIVLLLVLVIIKRKELLRFNIAYVSLIFFGLLIIMTLAFNQLWLTRRLLIPSIPIICLSIIEIVDKYKINKIIGGIMTILPLILFSVNINIYAIRTWESNNDVKINAYEALSKKDNSLIEPYLNNYAINYYHDKILAEDNYDIFEGVK